MEKETILKDIYKYYPIDLEENNDTRKSLRQMKVKNKSDIEGKRLFQDIAKIAKGYKVVDWTDYKSCCYEFKVLLVKNQLILDDDRELMKELNGVRKDLRIFISVLEPYYFMFVEETKYIEKKDKWTFSTMKTYSIEIENLLEKINSYLSEKGYAKLSDDDVKIIVPSIQTDLKEFNRAQVFDCLFTDLVSIT